MPPVEISLGDSRAHKLLVVHTNGWHAIPAPETFSRHSGIQVWFRVLSNDDSYDLIAELFYTFKCYFFLFEFLCDNSVVMVSHFWDFVKISDRTSNVFNISTLILSSLLLSYLIWSLLISPYPLYSSLWPYLPYIITCHIISYHLIPITILTSITTTHVRTGTCVILGDRNNTGLPFPIKLGDCFRLGSVGLVVSELRTADGEEQRLDSRMLQVSEVCIYYDILNVFID